MLVKLQKKIVEESIEILKSNSNKETVILWLGKRINKYYHVDNVFVPDQKAGLDYFFIPEHSMDKLMNYLKLNRKMIIAQVHTHPFTAFHSEVDDKWAIVRHVGAYSLVLPYFCSTTNADNFLINVATYILNEDNNWEQSENDNLIIYE